LALNEYVPSSKLLAGGRIYASRGLVRSFESDGGFGLVKFRFECTEGHIFYEAHDRATQCRICSSPLRSNRGKDALIPRFGYSCAAWDPPSWSGDPERVGLAELTSTVDFVNRLGLQEFAAFGGVEVLNARFCEGGTIFAANSGTGFGFAVCTACGYADCEDGLGDGRKNLPRGFESHAPLWARKLSQRCWTAGVTPVLRNKYLGAENDTDVLQIEIQTILTPYHSRDIGDRIAHTLGHALRISGAAIVEADVREISFIFLTAPREDPGTLLPCSSSRISGSGRHWSCLKAMQYIRNAAARPVWPVCLIRKARMTSSRGSWTARSHLSSLGAR
jgi:hypothetical protein